MRTIIIIAAISMATCRQGDPRRKTLLPGKRFVAKCKTCHNVQDAKNKVGPSLKGG